MSEESLESSGAESSGSNSGSEPQSPAEAQSSTTPQEAASQSTQENVPFHQHPRWQEVMNERREYKEKLTANERQLQELQQQLQKLNSQQVQPTKQENPLIKRLKEIDPEFGSEFEQVAALKEEMAAVRQWRENLEHQRMSQEAASKEQSLFEQYKVPEDIRDRYKREIRAVVYEQEAQGKRLGINDLDGIFKTVHEDYSKFLSAYDRKTRESYVTAKKSDAIPATQTGGQAPGLPIKGAPKTTTERKDFISSELRRLQQKV